MKLKTLIITVAAALSLAGCSSEAAAGQEQPSVQAQLDYAKGTITLPLDAYVPTREEIALIDKANDKLITDCVKKAGLIYPAPGHSTSLDQDRRFGIWNPDLAGKYGYGLPPSLSGSATPQTLPQETIAAVRKCRQEIATTLLPVNTGKTVGNATVINTVNGNAYDQARQDPRWSQIREEWSQCLRDQGIKPVNGLDEWMPEAPSDKQAEIRIAVADVKCKTTVNMIQRLADINAAKQTTLIEKNDAALTEARKNKESVVSKARDVVNANAS